MSDQEDTLLEFPCEFPIKAMGKASVNLQKIVLGIVKKFAPEVSEANMRTKPSKEGKYLSVTITITASSKEQLDNIYMAMTAHPDIMMAL